MKILMAGGGTLGSVTPLLAVAEELMARQPEAHIDWIGTNFGPEQKLIKSAGIEFTSIACGRWRRHFSLLNILDTFKIIMGFFQSVFFILKFHSQVVVTAGSYVAVPVAWAAGILGVPILVHQQDLRPGLANKLVAPLAKIITLAWPELIKFFAGYQTQVVGNPVRRQIFEVTSKKSVLNKIGWSDDKPIILVMGGGTGAEFINKLVIQSLPELTKFTKVIHITGTNKSSARPGPDYCSFDLIDQNMSSLLQVAEVVVARAGMGTISELSALAKPAIIIPIPASHQQVNADMLAAKQAALVLSQMNLTPITFVDSIKKLLTNRDELRNLSSKMGNLLLPGGAGKVADLVLKIAKL